MNATATVEVGTDPFDRVAEAVESVKERLARAARALNGAGVEFAVVGGNAVAAWVGSVDTSAVRNTIDVDILLDRNKFNGARKAMEEAGFVYRRSAMISGKGHIDMFLDGPQAKAREAVHVLLANEKVSESDPVAAPAVSESTDLAGYRVIALEALVRMKLVSFRDKDRMHLRDLAYVGLIDSTWTNKYPSELRSRLQKILDDPEG
ncbi:MAG: hypothetical protein AAGA58_04885 [Verrucomicrobiota bacterium]